MDWNKLTDANGIEAIKERSKTVPCLIFKHSTSCSISSVAKHRLESSWDFSAEELEPYYLDLLSYRPISQQVAREFEVHHESPQVLLIRNGECTYDASHLGISVAEIHECYADVN